MRGDAYVLLLEWCVGALLWPYRYARRWRLRLKLRRKMRTLGMIPCLTVCWCSAEVSRLAAQAPADSMVATVLARSVIGQWTGGTIATYCITWVAEREDRPHVLVVIDAEPADTTQHPICPKPDGGFYPLWIDGPVCPPGQVSPFREREWIIVRCGPDALSRYRRR